jgi:vacuolar-type H+-ATPase subunit H
MAKQALEYIKEAEEHSKQMIEQARAQAAKLVEDANLKADKDMADTDAKFRESAAKMKDDAWSRAQAQQKEYAAETEKLAAELTAGLAAKKDKAIELVVEVIAG